MEEHNKTQTPLMEMLLAVAAVVVTAAEQEQAQMVECDLSGNKTLDCN